MDSLRRTEAPGMFSFKKPLKSLWKLRYVLSVATKVFSTSFKSVRFNGAPNFQCVSGLRGVPVSVTSWRWYSHSSFFFVMPIHRCQLSFVYMRRPLDSRHHGPSESANEQRSCLLCKKHTWGSVFLPLVPWYDSWSSWCMLSPNRVLKLSAVPFCSISRSIWFAACCL